MLLGQMDVLTCKHKSLRRICEQITNIVFVAYPFENRWCYKTIDSLRTIGIPPPWKHTYRGLSFYCIYNLLYTPLYYYFGV